MKHRRAAAFAFLAAAALATARYVRAGGDAAGRFGWFTLVWLRTGAGWRAVHDHSS